MSWDGLINNCTLHYNAVSVFRIKTPTIAF